VRGIADEVELGLPLLRAATEHHGFNAATDIQAVESRQLMPNAVQADPARAPDVDDTDLPPFAEMAGRQSTIGRQDKRTSSGTAEPTTARSTQHTSWTLRPDENKSPMDEGVTDVAGRHPSEPLGVGARSHFHAVGLWRHPGPQALASLVDQFLEMFISVHSSPAPLFAARDVPNFIGHFSHDNPAFAKTCLTSYPCLRHFGLTRTILTPGILAIPICPS